ncbi:hypothetical protein ACFO1B_16875 [Dactylosporangium siamense]|uniref:Uncharacterized protein n=1 Tax=Dactylosporangium siamense TaxID=685454 RepID=A0A919PLP5_9ACTN|nr:hypothetical protein [Dactylosporangium siamense]GIG45516.1 hypothetical protein Dsi01nite_035570 [Dactylosporangium siamense]
MSTSASPVDDLLAAADRQWRTLGVQRGDRLALGTDLRAELEAAQADGLAPAELLGADPAAFARRLAEEAGVERLPPRYGPILAAAFFGAVVALIVGFVLATGLHEAFVAAFDLPRSVHVPVWLAGGGFYAGVAAVTIAGSVFTVRVLLRDAPRIRHTTTRMALLLPPAVAAAVAAAVAFGNALDYPLTPFAIGAEVAIVLVGFLATTVLARRWSITSGGTAEAGGRP